MEARLTPKEPLKIGWREWVGLPDLRVATIKAKVDTGARTSALHAYHIEPFRRGGALWLRFELHPMQRSEARKVACEARAIDERAVRNSGGGVERRYIIRTLLKLGTPLGRSSSRLQSRPDGLPHAAQPYGARGSRADRAGPFLSPRRTAHKAAAKAQAPVSQGKQIAAINRTSNS
jgi:hypothetical protein